MITIDLIEYNKFFTPKFKNLIFKKEKFLVLYGGSGSGKSYAAALKLIYDVLSNPKRYLVIRKVYRTLYESCYYLLKTVIINLGLQDFFEFSKAPLKINCKTGGEILFQGLDDVEKLKSITNIERVWIEEATEITEEDLEQIDARLRGGTSHQIMLTFNPVPSFLKEYFFDNIKPNTYIIHSTYEDNPYVGLDYQKTMESKLGTFRTVYTEGKWGLTEGIVYDYQLVEAFPDIENYVYGMDFGFNDPTAIVKCAVYDKQIYVEECLFKTHLTADDILDFNFNKKLVYADNSRPEIIEYLRRKRVNILPCRKGKDSVITGINFIKSHGKINIINNSKNIIKEIQLYCWKKDNLGKSMEVPEDGNDHLLDAFRYGIYTHYFKDKPVLTRKMLGF